MPPPTIVRIYELWALMVIMFLPFGDGMLLNVTSLTQVCATENFTKTRICDPNDYINDELMVQRSISDLETKKIKNCDSNIQFGLVIIDKMQLSDIYINSEDLHDYVLSNGRRYAKYLHDFFGVGRQNCGGTGILLFISIQDRVIYLSISAGLNHILTQSRINSIIELMRPYMRVGSYEGGVIRAIQVIDNYLNSGPPGFWEANQDFIICFGFVIFFVTAPALGGYFKRKRMISRLKEYDDVKKKLAQFDRDRRLALMGKYEITSCPICLDDFTSCTESAPRTQNESKTLLSKDINSPVHILNCGHAFHDSCWLEWKRKSDKYNVDICPICRERTDEIPGAENEDFQHFPRDAIESNNALHEMIPNQSRISGSDDVFYRERNFRLQRLALLHPRYVGRNQIHRWMNDDRIPLSEDSDFIRSDPSRVDFVGDSMARRRHEQYGGAASFDSFGGGSSGGNGGGGTW